jgi:ketosteroid isomerase-like protein
MRGIYLIIPCIFLFAGSLNSQRPIDTLIATERAFAATSVQFSTRRAFLEYVARDCSGYNEKGEPVNLFTEWMNRKEDSSKLSWRPSWAFIASSSDLGITTGPWEYRETRSQKTPVANGHFTTVWEKRPGENWKAVFDMGISQPEPVDDADSSVSTFESSVNTSDSSFHAGRIELTFILRFRNEGASAILKMADERAWLNLNGHFPYRGLRAIESALGGLSPDLQFEPVAFFVSSNNDLVAVHGKAFSPASGPHAYLRVWRKTESGEWKIVMMVLH